MEDEKKLMKVKRPVCFGERDLFIRVGKNKYQNSSFPISSDYFVSYKTFRGLEGVRNNIEIALGAADVDNLYKKVDMILESNYLGGRIIFLDGLPPNEEGQKIRTRIDIARKEIKTRRKKASVDYLLN